ncbi:LIC11996 family lipoprotein [Leptospira kirschneri]|uniref:LIC11996 family lipoprotein n=1 Tax=Leptospira kirschneri TaxID=29507 RepID=UPI00031D5625|nr:hypothetical protein [Leptospira kirschneri]KON76651.1 Uncharacterized protein NV38_0002679 [Leptospira kirschneri serovar Mozdok]KPZ76516.1 hypothetical protein APS47_14795 [Leptospira kirschneri serovar Mozdok]NDK06077.1 putative lipoprotein [Leptospira kirschneri serovar Mozdok]
MKKYYFILMLLSFLNCYKFEESFWDPKGTFGLLRILASASNGYANFMLNKYSAFRSAGTGMYISYVRRNFGSSDNPKNRIDLIIAYENSTDMIPTNVPMIGEQITSMIGFGFNPMNSNNYSILFEVKTVDSSGVSTYEYYYWTGSALPRSGSRMTFTKIIASEKIVGFGTYNVGVAEKAVFCEEPASGGVTTCYNVNNDFTNRVTIAGPIGTKCTYVIRNNAVGWCVDPLAGPGYSFYSTDGTINAFGVQPVGLVANYKTFPFDSFTGSYNFDIQSDFTQSHYIEHTNDLVRITTTAGDLTSLGGPLTSPGNSNQTTVSASGILVTDVINPVRSFNVGASTFLSFIAIPNSLTAPSAYLYRTLNTGNSWERINLTDLDLPAPEFTEDQTPSYTSALGVFGTNSGTEKLHVFINKKGSGLKRYVSTSSGVSWTLQETIQVTSE